ncbi:MAG: hypothetical protein RSG95_02105 [Bacilli bacterium]
MRKILKVIFSFMLFFILSGEVFAKHATCYYGDDSLSVQIDIKKDLSLYCKTDKNTKGIVKRNCEIKIDEFLNVEKSLFCPSKLYWTSDVISPAGSTITYYDFSFNSKSQNYLNINNEKSKVYNENDEEVDNPSAGGGSGVNKPGGSGSNTIKDNEELYVCDDNGVQKAFQIIGYLLFIIKILVPLLLIILGTIDFSKAIISSDDKAIKEATLSLIKRAIIGVVIFIIPTILNFAFSLVDGAEENSAGFTKCTNCLFSPTDDAKCSPKKIGE